MMMRVDQIQDCRQQEVGFLFTFVFGGVACWRKGSAGVYNICSMIDQFCSCLVNCEDPKLQVDQRVAILPDTTGEYSPQTKKRNEKREKLRSERNHA